MRAPVAPSGWPSEMPPPFGLTSPPPSARRARCRRGTGARPTRTPRSPRSPRCRPSESPAFASAASHACGLPCSIRCGSTPAMPNETKRARGSSPSRDAARLARDQHRGRAVDDLARVAGGDVAVRDERRLERGELLERRVAPRRLVDRERATPTCGFDDARPGRSRSRSGPRRSRATARLCDSNEYASSSSRESPHSRRSPRRRSPAGRSASARAACPRSSRRSSPSGRATSSRRRPRRRGRAGPTRPPPPR